MTSVVDDPSKIIISYGVNDCIPRMVIVQLSEVVQLLFEPQGMQ